MSRAVKEEKERGARGEREGGREEKERREGDHTWLAWEQ